MPESFIATAATPLRGRAPGFATILFRTRSSNSTFIQETRRSKTIRAFQKVEVPEGVAVAWCHRESVRAVGDEVLFGFLTANSGVLTGTRNELRAPLTEQLSRLEAYPFVRHQLAKFLDAPDALAEAGALTTILLSRDRGVRPRPRLSSIPDLDAIPLVELNAAAYRLVRAMPSASIERRFNLPLELGIALGKTFLPAQPGASAENALAFATSFRNPSPFPTLFIAGGEAGSYAALTLEDAIADMAHWLLTLRIVQMVGRDVDHRYFVTRLDLRGVFHDLTSMRDGVGAIDEEATDYSPTQELGSQLRRRGSVGIIYGGRRRVGSRYVCLFSPTPIVKVESQGAVDLSFVEDRVSWKSV